MSAAGWLVFLPGSAALGAGQVTLEEITDALVCYCGCANMVVTTCNCGTADKIRSDIKNQLGQGKAKEQIIQAYVDQHGEKGLAMPTKKGFNLLAWILPFLALVVAGVVVVEVTRKWAKRGRAVRPSERPLGNDELRKRIAEEVQQFDQ